jgi:4-hydroxymandelate oxidase
MTVEQLQSLYDFEASAQKKLDPMASAYFGGAARDRLTLVDNRRAWDRINLWYRVLVDVSERNISTTVLGTDLSMPILIAPTAFHGLAHQEAESATVRAAGQVGTIACVSTLSNVPLETLADVSTGPLWFQLYVYRDRGVTEALVRRAEAAGYEALVLTVDAAEIGTREGDHRHGFHLPNGLRAANLTAAGLDTIPQDANGSGLNDYVRRLLDPSLTWADVDWLSSLTKLPIVIKGLIRSDDARRAYDHGAAAVVVSNHGGRQLDTAPSTARALPYIADAVGDKIDILVDGGIRRGTDIVKALALGARAVLIGRPILWGLAHNGQRGVEDVLSMLAHELMEAMALCGCPSIESISKDLLQPSN